jgi:hypothetical protein
MQSLSIKTPLLSVLYIVSLFIVLTLMDFGLAWFLDNLLFPLLNWFNSRALFWKWLIVILGGFSVFIWFLQLFQHFSVFINIFLSRYFPTNTFTFIAGGLLCLLNIIANVMALWNAMPGMNVWLVLEFIILVIFLVFLNFSFLIKGKAQ